MTDERRDLQAAGAGALGFALIVLAAQTFRAEAIDPSLGVLLTLVVLPVTAAVGGALPAHVLGYDWVLSIIASASAQATMLFVAFGLAQFIPLDMARTFILTGSAVVTMLIVVTDRIYIERHLALTFLALALVIFWLVFTQPIHNVPGLLLGLLAWTATPAATSMIQRMQA